MLNVFNMLHLLRFGTFEIKENRETRKMLKSEPNKKYL